MQQVLQGIRGICTLRTVHAAPNFCDLGSQFFNFAQNVTRIIYEEDYICSKLDDQLRIPCLHKRSVSHLISRCTTPKKEEKLWSYSHGEFMSYNLCCLI